MMRQYERGVVFVLGTFEGARAASRGTSAPHPPDDGRNLVRKEFDHHFPRTICDDGAGSDPAIIERFNTKVVSAA
jgi:hypothetical protein